MSALARLVTWIKDGIQPPQNPYRAQPCERCSSGFICTTMVIVLLAVVVIMALAMAGAK